MKSKILYLIILFLSHQVIAKAQLVINEFMQSNIDCIMDDLNEFPDSWVEIYNAGDESVSLSNYKIGISDDPTDAWHLPNINVSSHGFALVYCDKEAKGLHASFRLDSGKGGSIYLFKGDIVEDKIENIAKQPSPNISYGRKTDGGDEFGYQIKPTPRGKNCGEITTKVLGNPVFETKGKVITSSSSLSYSVKLSLPEGSPEGSEIRYTLDGTEPMQFSLLYSKPIECKGTTVVRAKLFCDGWISPRSVTESFIVHPVEVTLPVVSFVTDSKYLFDDQIGIYVEGKYNSSTFNYKYDWRRPVNLEYFESANADAVLNQLCETRISGNASRGAKYKSLAIYANKRFGEKHFKHEFFPDQRPEMTKYKSLVFRNAGNDFDYLFMRDAIAQRSVAQYVDLDWQAWQPVIIYINGKYYGMLNLRERANESNVYTNYDGLEDVDAVENWWDVKEGDKENIDAFRNFFQEHGHTWEEYSKWMDVDEYINLIILDTYYNNVDFFGNNLFMWRPRTEDGRWRFIAKDVDYIMGIYGGQGYDYKYLNWIYNNEYDSSVNWANTYEATRLFRRLMEDKDFNRRFIDRFAIYMGDFLNYDAIWKNIWQGMYDKIKTEYPRHRDLINRWWPNYNTELTNAQSWVKNRTNFMYSHLAEYYQLGAPEMLVVNGSLSQSDRDKIDVEINEVPLSKSIFLGKFFENREVTLKGRSHDGNSAVKGWNVICVPSSGAAKFSTVQGATYSFTMPECSQYVVNAIVGIPDGIEENELIPSNSTEGAIYNVNGVRTRSLNRGLNIIKTADGKTHKIVSGK